MYLTKEKLEDIYHNNTSKKTCEILGISNPTLISYLKRYGIKPKGKGNRQERTKIKLL